ncbi:hypothetical protein BD289DRAFT_12845 [Coniella lustricola]|uniref:Uncharacterized protein n=1 Tax=Coniella lustricola TaxID=2025994 RepID=A0A2T3A4D4_9PEZI|nr:hypothetical protein BD289DRAFT_12845 [Coniella lustricola]
MKQWSCFMGCSRGLLPDSTPPPPSPPWLAAIGLKSLLPCTHTFWSVTGRSGVNQMICSASCLMCWTGRRIAGWRNKAREDTTWIAKILTLMLPALPDHFSDVATPTAYYRLQRPFVASVRFAVVFCLWRLRSAVKQFLPDTSKDWGLNDTAAGNMVGWSCSTTYFRCGQTHN